MVGLGAVESDEDVALLRRLIIEHHRATDSPIAATVLQRWSEYLPRFVKVMPHDLKRVLAEREERTRVEEPLLQQAV